MGQGLFESDEAYRMRMLREQGEKLGVSQGFFESDKAYEARVTRAVGSSQGVSQGLFESDAAYKQRVNEAVGSSMGVTRGFFESDASYNARVVREVGSRHGLSQGFFESDEDFAKGYLFPVWMGEIFEKGPFGHMQKHPKMWYNLGRWIALLRQPTLPNEKLASMKRETIDQLRTVAYTNLNKVRGSAGAGKEYNTLLQASVVAETLRREVAILQPHTVLCCGTYEAVKAALPDFVGRLISMPHPGAFKSTNSMLEQLRRQDKEITL